MSGTSSTVVNESSNSNSTSGSVGNNSFTSPLVESFTSSSQSSSSTFVNSFTSPASNSGSESTLPSLTSPASSSFSSSTTSQSQTIDSPLPTSSPQFSTSTSPPETKLGRTSSDGDSEGWPCGACTFINSGLMRMCEVCTAPRPGLADDDKRSRINEQHFSVNGGGGGSVSSNHYLAGNEYPIHKFVFQRNPYPEHHAIEFAKGEQSDVWIEGMGWCVGTIIKVEPERVCFHVVNKGAIWKDKNSEQLAPINTQTHYYDHFLRRVDEGSDTSKALVPYVPQAVLSSHSISSTISSSTPFVTTTTITVPTNQDSNSTESTLGVVPIVPTAETSVEQTTTVKKREKN